MLGLKIFVGVVTFLLIAGIGVLIGGLAMQAKLRTPAESKAEVTIPPGGRLVETAIQGDRAVVRVALPDGREELHVFDLGSGRAVGTIAIKPAP